MIDRRELLAGGAGSALAVAAGPALAQSSEDAKLDALLMKHLYENLDRSPEFATGLGLDKDARAPLRWKLADRSLAEAERQNAITRRRWTELKAIDRKALTGQALISYDIAAFRYENAVQAVDAVNYGAPGARGPYVLSQLTGAYYSVPDFLANQHPVNTKDDADAYISRLNAFATALDQETEMVRHDAGLGVIPPDFILAKTIGNLKKVRGEPAATSVLVRTVADKAKAKGLGDYEAAAAAVYSGPVAAALDRQIATLESLQPKATHEAGVWRLPNGPAFYQVMLTGSTTLPATGEEVHKIGLEQVAYYQGRIDALLKAQGMSQGSVGARLARLNADPAQVYPNTDAAKVELLGQLNELVKAITPRLPEVFNRVPKAALEIRRVPAYIESGAPLGYYQGAPLDGSRPGAYYINLKDTADWPKYGLPTLTYHEGVPGHHFQISLSREAGELPLYRKVGGFSAYSEGWALYAEQLAWEMGMYKGDALGEVGALQSLLFRSVRLVVDTGMHVKKWSREKCIAYMVENCGRTEGASTNENERYAASPGQACSYKMGHTTLIRLRDDAKKRMGARFDLKAFHDAVLLQGAVPLTVLERAVGAWATKG